MIKWIIAAEVAFWIVIIAGLFSRYVLKWNKVSILFFLLTPLIDLGLVALTVIDLRNGATATTAHGLSVIYIGVSIAYGKTMIAWADEKFQSWFLKKPSSKKTLTGMAKAIHELKMWARHVTAFSIGSLLFWGIITFVGSQATEALNGIWRVWGLVLLIDAIICLSYFIFPKKVTS
ncbi:hypothetical protein [Lysinibacillus endophyticus]|uniref:Uncharacterized protein n=1 Tax=Ureibacillus endophyticus TaxID=1978490 RepID=A0A494Z8T6_9BACL|nr:hypothetical protein [Lysinibacillus endophyticus]MCP1143429.1 hypothetical protein [Lysinibacillus endophyticus]RKQ19051.1 hypothetical protein D8M03_04360 [Lysinibacillus endophyticus]